jgi:hypothetical protein
MACFRAARFRLLLLILVAPIFCGVGGVCHGFSLLTHEQVVDILWKDAITPTLLRRFPGATDQDLRKAHAYAYGGCLVQDMGYYPLGNKFFSDLTHYVRSGDFVANLINESRTLNEFAFGLGALAHYSGDTAGHPFVNRAVALTFPKLRQKYGDEVTYEEDPRDHIRVEFGFDLTQVAKHRYTSDQYHDFIGFEVSIPLLERAFKTTYGLPLDELLQPEDLSIGTFRRAASRLIPEMTRVAMAMKRPEKVMEDKANPERRRFLYHLSRSEYEREWGRDYRKPGLVTRSFAFFLKWVPKLGPLKALDFKVPTPETEDLYLKAVNETVVRYRQTLREAVDQKGIAGGDRRVELPNVDFDTGRPSRAGEYARSDKAHMELLDRLTKREERTRNIEPELRAELLAYFSATPKIDLHSRKDGKAWRKAVAELNALKHDSGTWQASAQHH